MAQNVYLLLGTNEGDRDRNLSKAVELIGERAGKLMKRSSVYETAPWGKTDQAAFLNLAVSISSELPPLELLEHLKGIEKEVGRVSTEKWGPRVIDIDILFFGDEIIQEPELQVPHPYLPVRRFGLLPMSEIAGEFVHPVLRKTINELLRECPDGSEVKVVVGS
jgi:2-amino-4-hydroxy-6-hydroxymethyldihydropteridine diphosphokinase